MRGSEALRGAHKAAFSTAILLYRLTGVPAAHHRKKNLTTARSLAACAVLTGGSRVAGHIFKSGLLPEFHVPRSARSPTRMCMAMCRVLTLTARSGSSPDALSHPTEGIYFFTMIADGLCRGACAPSARMRALAVHARAQFARMLPCCFVAYTCSLHMAHASSGSCSLRVALCLQEP